MARDQYDDIAAATLPSLNEAGLAHVYRSVAKIMEDRDHERKHHALVVSALLELLGGQALLPAHALANSPGYQAFHDSEGTLVLQTVLSDGH